MATNQYIQSDLIKVFPTSKRNDAYDRNARFTSEQNLISIVNRLTNIDSFIINGLTVEKKNSRWVLNAGTANIHGYYFDITEDIDINDITKSGYLYLRIKVKKETMTNESLSFTELQGIDDTTSIPVYKGLEILQSDTIFEDAQVDSTTGFIYYALLIARYTSGAWVNEKNSTLKYKVSDVKVDFNNTNYPDSFSFTGSLEDWLLNNYIVDDGELT